MLIDFFIENNIINNKSLVILLIVNIYNYKFNFFKKTKFKF